METFEAILVAQEETKWNKGGFKSEEDAYEYVKSQSCQDCKESGIDRCAAEWIVCKEN